MLGTKITRNSMCFITLSTLNEHVACLLTARIVFELQSIPNEGVSGSQLRDRLHLKPFVQVIAQQLVG